MWGAVYEIQRGDSALQQGALHCRHPALRSDTDIP